MSHQMRRRFQEHTQQQQQNPTQRNYQTRYLPRNMRLREIENGLFVNPETGERYTRTEMTSLFGKDFLRRNPQFSPSEEEE